MDSLDEAISPRIAAAASLNAQYELRHLDLAKRVRLKAGLSKPIKTRNNVELSVAVDVGDVSRW